MSWLRPESMQPSDYDPEQKVRELVARYGDVGNDILKVFNDVDPFHVLAEKNVDEYVGYVERFVAQLGSRHLTDLKLEEVAALVRGSFHTAQIEQGFVDEIVLDIITQKILQLKEGPRQ